MDKNYSLEWIQNEINYYSEMCVSASYFDYIDVLKQLRTVTARIAELQSRIARMEKAGELQELTNDIVAWATKTFGDRKTTAISVIRHLQKEVIELLEAVESSSNFEEEYADCFMLLLDSANTQNISVNKLIELTRQKLEKNKNRKWGEKNADGIIEHIK